MCYSTGPDTIIYFSDTVISVLVCYFHCYLYIVKHVYIAYSTIHICIYWLINVVQSPSVDCQHAIIEYRDVDETFALQDLNTTYGTFVNDCRIGNAYVRLYPGDVIRFGNSNTSYELVIHGESSVSTL